MGFYQTCLQYSMGQGIYISWKSFVSLVDQDIEQEHIVQKLVYFLYVIEMDK